MENSREEPSAKATALGKERSGLAVSRFSSSGGFSGSVIHKIFQFFAGFEEGNLLRGNFHFFAGLRIAPNTPAGLARAKTAEAANLDFLSLLQGRDDAVENGFNDGFGFCASELGDVDNFLDQVGLRECGCRLLAHVS